MDAPKISLDSKVLATELSGNIAEIARKLGISRQHLNNILKGRRKPSADLLLKIQMEYSLSANEISAIEN
jgi:transcriptional regulator with XRE-family HTH domain